ncbi:MAG: hypothetical protein ACRDDZ_04950 [Marinifilaceae bacterium]
MKQLILLLTLATLPLVFTGVNKSELKASPRWERNIALLPEAIKETLAVAFPTYIIVEYAKMPRGNYKILLRGAEDAMYILLTPKGDLVDEAGAIKLTFDHKQRHIILF